MINRHKEEIRIKLINNKSEIVESLEVDVDDKEDGFDSLVIAYPPKISHN